MSYCTLYAAFEDGDITPHKDYRNSWRGAMAVWTYMVERYLRPPKDSFWLSNQEFLTEKLYPLASDLNIPFEDRVTMATTYDRVLVAQKDFKLLCQCMNDTGSRMPAQNHIVSQARDIAGLPKKCRAVGWRQTSVSADMWDVYVNGEWQDRNYNIDIDDEHWWLFDEVKR